MSTRSATQAAHELELLLRRADRRSIGTSSAEYEEEIGEVITQARALWQQIPFDLRQQIFASLRQMWTVRGAIVPQVLAWVGAQVVRSRLSVAEAVRRAGARFNLAPRSGPPQRRGMTGTQVRQYHRRQLQRGGRPGLDPRFRRR